MILTLVFLAFFGGALKVFLAATYIKINLHAGLDFDLHWGCFELDEIFGSHFVHWGWKITHVKFLKKYQYQSVHFRMTSVPCM